MQIKFVQFIIQKLVEFILAWNFITCGLANQEESLGVGNAIPKSTAYKRSVG